MEARALGGTRGARYPFWLPDGQRFVVNESSHSLDEPIIVTTDWQRFLSASQR